MALFRFTVSVPVFPGATAENAVVENVLPRETYTTVPAAAVEIFVLSLLV